MNVSTIKPQDSVIPEILKLLKDGFDDAKLDIYEPGLYRAAMLSRIPEVVMWQGEILHQLALRAERRGDNDKAFLLYRRAVTSLQDTTVLGEARCLRDLGMRKALVGETDNGMELVRNACELHEQDVQSATNPDEEAKGERQLLIAHGYLLRARVVGDEDRRSAIQELIDLAVVESPAFSVRDQKVLVDFTAPHCRGAAKRVLHRRQVELNVRRLRPVAAATSITHVVFDTQLHVTSRTLSTTSSVVGSILRKEWSIPRPW